MRAKRRLDQLLVEREFAENRTRAQALVMAGAVHVAGVRAAKPGNQVAPDAQITVRTKEHPWASRGGLKLAHALDHFSLSPAGRVALDVGASAGGFTDVLLAHGAAKVYAVDVGRAQLDWRLRRDARVVVLEGVNARFLTRAEVPEAVDFITCDASFIGLETVLPAPMALSAPETALVALIKPQFEVGRASVGKGGVVRDPALHAGACERIQTWLAARPGWRVLGVVESPIKGPKGNREFLIAAIRGEAEAARLARARPRAQLGRRSRSRAVSWRPGLLFPAGPSTGHSRTRKRVDTETDVLVIGGGIMGCAAAYYLAREGTDVLLIERGELNAEGSGTNAGSLHVQLPSSLFHEFGEAMIEARAQTTPLRLEAVRTWRELADELDDDIELAVTGGLMVAVTDAQLRFLEMKMARERRYGATVELVTGPALFALAPYLSERVLGAEFCALEGTINPTLATPALWRAAVRAGARLWRGTELRALERASGSYVAATSRARIRCARVVNAAGSWSGEIARMAGFSIPMGDVILHMNVTESAAPFLGHLVQHAGARLTAKQATNGNVLIGGGWPARGESARGHIDVGRESMERNLGVAQSVIPDLARLRLIRCWAGRNIVGDNLPVLGSVPGVPNFFNAVTGTGYTGGPVSARLLAEVMAGRKPSFDIQPYSVERFARAAAAS